MVGTIEESKQSYKCRYCEKPFRKETTLIAHLCENKRRWQQEKEVGVQLGLKAYLRFYETSQGSARLKNYETFVASPYYNAFVKFGRYCQSIRCINFSNFLDWLLRNNKKIDFWCRDTIYGEWMSEYVKTEATSDALERALKEMTDYAEEHPELRNGFSDYFRYASPNRVCFHITTGRVSPWIVYNCTSGLEFLESINAEQMAIIMPWINPEYWDRKFRDYVADTEWCWDVLQKAGL
jgi:hypothetical protein